MKTFTKFLAEVQAPEKFASDSTTADAYGLARDAKFKQAYRLALRHMSELELPVAKHSPYGVGHPPGNLAAAVCLGALIALCDSENLTQRKCADAAELLALLCKFGAGRSLSMQLWQRNLRDLEAVLGPENNDLKKIHAMMLADELDRT